MSSGEAEEAGPDFMCVGAQKGGTRWLYDQLQLHPDFWMPPIKELSYFTRAGSRKAKARRLLTRATANLDRLNRARAARHRSRLTERDLIFLAAMVRLERTVDLAAYAGLFSARGSSIVGDITPAYSTLGAEVIADICQRFSGMKVVFIARDPVERLWSQLRMDMAKGRLDAVADAESLRAAMAMPAVGSRSSQSDIVERWRGQAGDRFGLFFFDELVADPVGLRRKIVGFLGGDPDKASGLPADFNRKAGKGGGSLPPAFRELIATDLAEELRRSAAILGGPAVAWARKYGA